MALDIQKTIEKIQEEYAARPKTEKHNILVYGESGVGKSHGVLTLPKPVLYHVFDLSGIPAALEPAISRGEILPELFNAEDPDKPTEWLRWGTRFDQLRAGGLFSSGVIKSYALDSITSAAEYCFNKIFKGSGKKIDDDLRRLYNIQHVEFRANLMQALSLPVNVYCTGHLIKDKDETTGAMHASLAFSPKLNRKIYAMFEEIFVALPQNTSDGPQFRLLTKSSGMYLARTVMGSERFDQYEDFDIEALIEKSKLPPKPKEKKKPANTQNTQTATSVVKVSTT